MTKLRLRKVDCFSQGHTVEGYTHGLTSEAHALPSRFGFLLFSPLLIEMKVISWCLNALLLAVQLVSGVYREEAQQMYTHRFLRPCLSHSVCVKAVPLPHAPCSMPVLPVPPTFWLVLLTSSLSSLSHWQESKEPLSSLHPQPPLLISTNLLLQSLKCFSSLITFS